MAFSCPPEGFSWGVPESRDVSKKLFPYLRKGTDCSSHVSGKHLAGAVAIFHGELQRTLYTYLRKREPRGLC